MAYKILGQSAPANTSNVDLYTVGAGKSTVISTLHIANVTGSPATCRVYVRNAGATAADSNAFAKDVTIAANSIWAATEGITLNAADVITVQSSIANALTFHAFGNES
jgi:hypothetical protein